MTDPSQYFKGRTVQEQMNEVIGYVDTRAAEVATDAIASDVAQVHQDMLDADADASAAAASAAAAAGTLANAVKKTGESSQSIDGDIAISGDTAVQGQLSVIGGCDLRAPVKIPVSPTNNDDAASKKYVDDADATKISITDINSYAVGLTGNQTDIYGSKTFEQLICEKALVRSMYYSVGSSSTAQPWRLIYKMENPPSSNTNTILTFVYSGTRAGSNGGATPAIISVIGYGNNVQAVGLGSSASTCVKIVKLNDGKIYVFAYAKNVNSGSGSTAYNVIDMRSDTRWEKDTTGTPYDINNGVVTDGDGNIFISGTEVTVTI